MPDWGGEAPTPLRVDYNLALALYVNFRVKDT